MNSKASKVSGWRAAVLLATIIACHGVTLFAQTRTNVLEPVTESRGEPELTVCSQNLANYGNFTDSRQRVPGLSNEEYQDKEKELCQRFIRAQCDVIAVQELLGRSVEVSTAALQGLAERMKSFTNRSFEVVTGPSNDPMARLGFLVAKDRAEIMSYLSYYKVELPKLSEKQKPRLFTRGPLEVQLRVKPLGEAEAKTVTLVNFHFKSRRGKEGDPAGLEWETWRMEMSEALRRIIESRHSRAFARGETLLVVLGDRNSHFDTASARILEGTLALKQFRGSAPCRLSKRGVPLCQAGNAIPQRLFSVLTSDPDTKNLPGTFKHKKEYSWLDDILLPTESLRFAWETYESVGDFDSGVVYEPKDASDHALTYVRLNW